MHIDLQCMQIFEILAVAGRFSARKVLCLFFNHFGFAEVYLVFIVLAAVKYLCNPLYALIMSQRNNLRCIGSH